MEPDILPLVVRAYHETHNRIISLVSTLSEDELAWRPNPAAHPIAFEVWHLARWADHLQAALSHMTDELAARLGPRSEIWRTDELAVAWGFTPEQLGFDQTGMLMADDAVAHLPLPSKNAVLNYLQRSFAAAEEALAAVDARQFVASERPSGTDPVAQALHQSGAILSHLTHDNRHLGMIEYMLGQQGRPGTATR